MKKILMIQLAACGALSLYAQKLGYTDAGSYKEWLECGIQAYQKK